MPPCGDGRDEHNVELTRARLSEFYILCFYSCDFYSRPAPFLTHTAVTSARRYSVASETRWQFPKQFTHRWFDVLAAVAVCVRYSGDCKLQLVIKKKTCRGSPPPDRVFDMPRYGLEPAHTDCCWSRSSQDKTPSRRTPAGRSATGRRRLPLFAVLPSVLTAIGFWLNTVMCFRGITSHYVT